MLHKAWNSKGEMPYCFPRSAVKFQGHTVQNITDFDPNWAFPDYRPVAAFKSLRFALFIHAGWFATMSIWNSNILPHNENTLTHWRRVTHICVSKLTIIGSDNGLSPNRRQAIIWTNAGILLIGPLGTNFNEISIEIHKFSFKKIHFKMSSGKWQPSCLGLNVLMKH